MMAGARGWGWMVCVCIRCCNRPHVFEPMEVLQAELSPIAMYVAPSAVIGCVIVIVSVTVTIAGAGRSVRRI